MDSLFRLIFIILLVLLPMAELKTNPGDVEALMAFKAAVNPSSILEASCLSSWNFNDTFDPCDNIVKAFCGYKCSDDDPNNKRIITIELDTSSPGYIGTLSPAIGNLTALQTLDISGNSFNGPIPETLGNCVSLQLVVMENNKLTGSIPSSLSKLVNLMYFAVNGNQLEGRLSRRLLTLPSLKNFRIYSNNLSGPIPSMRKMKKLDSFDGSFNKFTRLPPAFPNMISEITLRNNRLTGELTGHKLHELSQLAVLDLGKNAFTGEISGELFAMPSMQDLGLDQNQFTSLGVPNLDGVDLRQFLYLELNNNQLSGPLPVFLTKISGLSILRLSSNRFNGAIPEEFGSKAFMGLYLNGNYLSGEIPRSFLNIPNTEEISLNYNCLEKCPQSLVFCQGGNQRPKSECESG